MGARAAHKDMLSILEMEPDELGNLNRVLQGGPKRTDKSAQDRPKLVGVNNEETVLPEGIYRLLCDIVPLLERGDSVFLMQGNRALTTQEAAELLGMSRTYLTKLVDSGAIPSFRVGSHRRIRFKDIVEYQGRRDADRQESMDAILAQSDELDLHGCRRVPP